jgi:hypothetical protein
VGRLAQRGGGPPRARRRSGEINSAATAIGYPAHQNMIPVISIFRNNNR